MHPCMHAARLDLIPNRQPAGSPPSSAPLSTAEVRAQELLDVLDVLPRLLAALDLDHRANEVVVDSIRDHRVAFVGLVLGHERADPLGCRPQAAVGALLDQL